MLFHKAPIAFRTLCWVWSLISFSLPYDALLDASNLIFSSDRQLVLSSFLICQQSNESECYSFFFVPQWTQMLIRSIDRCLHFRDPGYQFLGEWCLLNILVWNRSALWGLLWCCFSEVHFHLLLVWCFRDRSLQVLSCRGRSDWLLWEIPLL